MEFETIIKSLALGYFLAGFSALLNVLAAPVIDKPAIMMNPSIFKKIYWVIAWPLPTFLQNYLVHKPNKARGIVYSILGIVTIW